MNSVVGESRAFATGENIRDRPLDSFGVGFLIALQGSLVCGMVFIVNGMLVRVNLCHAPLLSAGAIRLPCGVEIHGKRVAVSNATAFNGSRTTEGRRAIQARFLVSANSNGAPYFILTAACFAAKACCFCCFAAFALSCFCAACLCTASGDLSPIICLAFGCGFTDPQHVHFSKSDWNREFRRGCCQIAIVFSFI